MAWAGWSKAKFKGLDLSCVVICFPPWTLTGEKTPSVETRSHKQASQGFVFLVQHGSQQEAALQVPGLPSYAVRLPRNYLVYQRNSKKELLLQTQRLFRHRINFLQSSHIVLINIQTTASRAASEAMPNYSTVKPLSYTRFKRLVTRQERIGGPLRRLRINARVLPISLTQLPPYPITRRKFAFQEINRLIIAPSEVRIHVQVIKTSLSNQ